MCRSNQFERARDAYKELIELEPESAAHVQGYRQVCARLDPVAPEASADAGATPEAEPHTLEEFLSEDEPALPPPELPARGRRADRQPPSAKPNFASRFPPRRAALPRWSSPCNRAPEDLRLNRSLGLLYRQAGDAARAARCYSTMQRVLEKLGETEAAGFYASLAGSGQTTTWEAKGSEFTARDFDLAPPRGRR